MIKFISVIMGLICASCTSFAFITPKSETRYSMDFAGGNLVRTQERKIYYAKRVDDYYINPYEAPTFVSTKPNACAVDVGGNALIYYDRLFDDLVSNYKHTYIFGKFNYGKYNDGIAKMFDDLYERMGANAQGTSVNGFLSGMRSYVSGKGHSITFEKVTGDYYNTNFVYIKEQLKKEKIAAIFLSGFSISTVGGPILNDGYDYVLHNVYDGHHVMLVYGYEDFNYYDSDGKHILRDTYFYVSTGYVGAKLALLNINRLCNVDDMYLLDIK